MLIKKIKAKNFKTYLNLDLDIAVEKDKPIILIGGANGGGKTTLFESIYGALYGLQIHNARQFKELLNAGATPFSPPSGLATGSFNGLHTKSKFLANRVLRVPAPPHAAPARQADAD